MRRRTPGDDPLFQESIFLVRADDEADARMRGAAAARTAQTSYENVDGEPVMWRFVEVTGVFELFDDVPGDGTEVFSRFIDRLPTAGAHDLTPDPGS
jgi:hypothetical protein